MADLGIELGTFLDGLNQRLGLEPGFRKKSQDETYKHYEPAGHGVSISIATEKSNKLVREIKIVAVDGSRYGMALLTETLASVAVILDPSLKAVDIQTAISGLFPLSDPGKVYSSEQKLKDIIFRLEMGHTVPLHAIIHPA